MMAANDVLLEFVRDALTRGASRPRIAEALDQAGWSREQVHGVLAAFATVDFPIPVPRPRASLSARDAFLYLLLFTTLYLVAFNLGSLMFQFINQAFPDPASVARDTNIRAAIRWSVSTLVVAFPIFVYVSWRTRRDIWSDPVRRTSPVRRWLTYLTLFVAACILIGDVVSLVYNFLGGELTIRFSLKALTVGLIAGSIFWYYLSELRRDEGQDRS